MSEQFLGLLQTLLLVLLYLFFARVLWAVWTEVRADRRTARVMAGGADTATLLPPPVARVVITAPDARRGSSFELGHELTVGRSGACQVPVAEDTFASQVHARLYRDGADTFVEDLGSTNGTYLNGDRIVVPKPLHQGDRIQIGGTIVEAQ
ncbi:MAG: FHA domain-containing protein [Acidimicrobiales bacterium]